MQYDPLLARVLRNAVRKYVNYDNVCGVSFGTKFKNGRSLPDIQAVQFFVTQKKPLTRLAKRLPQYLLGRKSGDKIDRTQRIQTDVIELKNLELCCFAGDEVLGTEGSTGSLALICEEQVPARTIVITCAHVVGNFDQSPSPGQLRGGNIFCLFRGQTIINTVKEGSVVEYDIAIGEINNPPEAITSLAGPQGTFVFQGFGSEADFFEDTKLDCASVMSGQRQIKIVSEETTFREIRTPGNQFVTVRNLIACKGKAVRGDSGGIVYKDDRAVGIIVAKADDDWVFIHPLEDAIAHLEHLRGVRFQVL